MENKKRKILLEKIGPIAKTKKDLRMTEEDQNQMIFRNMPRGQIDMMVDAPEYLRWKKDTELERKNPLRTIKRKKPTV
jgi:hypothetical protein